MNNRQSRLDEAVKVAGQNSLNALAIYFEICYGDLDEAKIAGYFDGAIEGITGSRVMGEICATIADLRMDKADVKKHFLAVASEVQKRLNLKLTPQKAWSKIKEIVDEIEFDDDEEW